jgi:hypothetical protein
MNYYNEESCTNNFTQIVYYSFNYFASQIYYNNGEDEDEDEEKDSQDGGAFVCNGACYKRAPNSDILVNPNAELTKSDYNKLNNEYKAYSCIYNNIIQSATIDIVRYSDKKCKNQLGNEYHFKGTDFCWKINDIYSFRPLYYEDDEDKIY